MSSTVFDSLLFRDMFGTPAMRDVFSDTAYLERVVEVEVALAQAQSRLGLVPQDAADAIAALCHPAGLDHERLRRDTDNVGYPILPIVTQLAEQCGDAGGRRPGLPVVSAETWVRATSATSTRLRPVSI